MNRQIIYLLLLASIAFPLIFGWTLPPARMQSSEKVFSLIESLPDNPSGSIALLALDFGPGTQAENQPQAEVVLEHLFRKRIPVVIFTAYALGERFAVGTPERVSQKLSAEVPGQTWQYGIDWIVLGYKPGGPLFLQALAQAESLPAYLGKDVKGIPLADYPRFKEIKTLKDVIFAGEFTGLVGMLSNYIQYLQRSDYVPPLVHGCTSITIPEAYIYLDSEQLRGLFEGIAGAAWYGELLTKKFPERSPGETPVINTALGSAHILIMVLILIGNCTMFFAVKEKR